MHVHVMCCIAASTCTFGPLYIYTAFYSMICSTVYSFVGENELIRADCYVMIVIGSWHFLISIADLDLRGQGS